MKTSLVRNISTVRTISVRNISTVGTISGDKYQCSKINSVRSISKKYEYIRIGAFLAPSPCWKGLSRKEGRKE